MDVGICVDFAVAGVYGGSLGGRGNIFGTEGLAFRKGRGADGGDCVRGKSVGTREEQVGDEPGGDQAGGYDAPVEVWGGGV